MNFYQYFQIAITSCLLFALPAMALAQDPPPVGHEVTITAAVPDAAPPAPSGSGGGGGGGIVIQTTAVFKGRAYPKSTVTLLEDGRVAATTVAGADAMFEASVSGLSGGNYIFSLYSEDAQGRRSALLTFPVSVTAGVITTVSGIFLAPTIAVDKAEVRRGENIAIFGQTAPSAEITVSVSSEEEFFGKVKADQDGVYIYNFDTTPLTSAQHFAKSKAAISGSISPFSAAIAFRVGARTILAESERPALRGDLNNDGLVNLIDFSIAAYWYKRPGPPAHVDLNGDGEVDLADLSIMAYYWIG